MRFFQKINIKDIILLSVFLFAVTNSIYTKTSLSFAGGGSANLLTQPVLYYIYLLIQVALLIGYVTYIILREED